MRRCELRFVYDAPDENRVICNSLDAHKLLRELWDESLINIQEQTVVIMLDATNAVLTWRCIHTGGHKNTPLDVKLILAASAGVLASRVIVAHNHTANILKPSPADIFWTNKLFRALALVDIELSDHLILTRSGYFSYTDEGVRMD